MRGMGIRRNERPQVALDIFVYRLEMTPLAAPAGVYEAPKL